jgi:hypothetical protein
MSYRFDPLRRRKKKFNAKYVISSGGEISNVKSTTIFNTIERYLIQNVESSDASFGTLITAKRNTGSVAPQRSGGRCVIGGGSIGTAPSSRSKTMEYIDVRSGGGAASFGDLDTERDFTAGCSSGYEGHFCGGINAAGVRQTTIQKIKMSTLSDSTSFGAISAAATCPDATQSKSMLYCFVMPQQAIEYKAFKNDSTARSFSDAGTGVFSPIFSSNWEIGLLFGGILIATYQTTVRSVSLKGLVATSDFATLSSPRALGAGGGSQSKALSIKGLSEIFIEVKTTDHTLYKTRNNVSQFSGIGIKLGYSSVASTA